MKRKVKILTIKDNRPDIVLGENQIFILTGKINSGKTSVLSKWVIDWHQKQLKIEGVLSETVIKGGNKIGYNAVDINSGEIYPLVNIKSFFQETDWQLGKYYFNTKNYLKLIDKFKYGLKADLYAIDEIGPLEIYEHKGYFELLKIFIQEKTASLLIVVRKECVNDVVKLLDTISD
ncbi:MAG: hypothetical protein KAR38_06695 [Calditrichia bacterium]|nr:hypothetical protein [Calditrichia bacterium]